MVLLNQPTLNGFQPGTAGTVKTEVELSISGRNLLDLDTFSKSDPLCVVYTKKSNQIGEMWKEISRTECIDNNLNPDFATKILVEYLFEQQQLMRFEVYDIDSHSNDLREHDFIGSAECTLGQIVSARGINSNGLMLRLINHNNANQNCGEIIVRSEEMTDCKDEIELKLGANIKAKRQSNRFYIFISILIAALSVLSFSLYIGLLLFVILFLIWMLSKPSGIFLTISRSADSSKNTQNMVVVHRTETNDHPTKIAWKTLYLPIKTFCNGDVCRPIKIELYEYRRNGNHTRVGEVLTTTQMLLQQTKQNSDNHTYSKAFSSSGDELVVFHCQVKKIYSFLDYIKGGTELACTVSIDFTASNGDPFRPDSLHYIHANGKDLLAKYMQM